MTLFSNNPFPTFKNVFSTYFYPFSAFFFFFFILLLYYVWIFLVYSLNTERKRNFMNFWLLTFSFSKKKERNFSVNIFSFILWKDPIVIFFILFKNLYELQMKLFSFNFLHHLLSLPFFSVCMEKNDEKFSSFYFLGGWKEWELNFMLLMNYKKAFKRKLSLCA